MKQMKNILISTAGALALSVSAPAFAHDHNGEKDMAKKQDMKAASAEADAPYDQSEIDAIATLVEVTSYPIVQVGDYAFPSANAHVAKRVIGKTVYGPNGDEIGSVNDIIMNDDAQITSYVVSTGGFLGIGDKDIAVPLDKFSVEIRDDNSHKLIVASTAEELKNMSEFDESQADWRASDLIGQEINFDTADAGDIENPYIDDFIFGLDGKPDYAVVEYGGVLGFGEKSRLVPFERVMVAEGDGETMIDIAPRDLITGVSFVYTVDDAAQGKNSATKDAWSEKMNKANQKGDWPGAMSKEKVQKLDDLTTDELNERQEVDQ